MKRCGASLVIVLGLSGAPAFAQATSCSLAAETPVAANGPVQPSTTKHVLKLSTGSIPYEASWAETLLEDAAGTPQASISATSYVRSNVKDKRSRPVVFFFNGGPGASSSPLHFGGFGPRALGEADASGKRSFTDNPSTLLDSADLIFIDPVGTGFSRPLGTGGGEAYWNVEGDAGAALKLARDWLKANVRETSPVYFVGESYGGYRLGTMAKSMADMNIAGIVLVSPALDFGASPDQTHVQQLPAFSVAAWYHRSRDDGRTVDQVWAEARRFAESDYLVALQQGHALPVAERSRVAARVAELTGMTLATVERSNLRLDSQSFLETLVPGKVVGRLDMRVAAPKPEKPLNADRPAAANDPALGLGRTNVIVSKPIGDYLRNELKVQTSRDYYSLTLDVNFKWNWTRPGSEPGSSWGVADNFARLLAKKTSARLLVLSGYYDLAVPAGAPGYALNHADIPLDRVTLVTMAAGHTVFSGDDNLGRVSAMLREFVKPR